LNLLVKTVSLHQAKPILIPSPYRNLFKRKETDLSSLNLTNVFAIFMMAEIRASDRAVGIDQSGQNSSPRPDLRPGHQIAGGSKAGNIAP